jgi:hypothetical protein
VSSQFDPKQSLFLDILRTLERIGAPYMIIGGFASTLYGATRVTYDIDIVVSLNDRTIEALVAAYQLPRYYADPVQIRDSMRRGIQFNVIDSTRCEKADLIPLGSTSPYHQAFQRRVRRRIALPGEQVEIERTASGEQVETMEGGQEPLLAWFARPDDVIVGKLMAWAEGRSRRHETDVHDMLVARELTTGVRTVEDFDEAYVDARAKALGEDVDRLWQAIKEAARREAKS